MRTCKYRVANWVAVAVLFCLIAALMPAAAQAHEPAPTQVPYEVYVDRTREVPVFGWIEQDVFGWVEHDVFGWVEHDVYGWVEHDVFGWVTCPRNGQSGNG